LQSEQITNSKIDKIIKLNQIAEKRHQTLAQMALAWVLRNGTVTSAVIGASRLEQLEENLQILNNLEFSEEELNTIEAILQQ